MKKILVSVLLFVAITCTLSGCMMNPYQRYQQYGHYGQQYYPYQYQQTYPQVLTWGLNEAYYVPQQIHRYTVPQYRNYNNRWWP